MKNLLILFQRTVTICILFTGFHWQLFAQSEPVSAFLGVSKKAFIHTCQEEKWKFTINERGSMSADYPGGNWYVSFNKDDVIDLINITCFGKAEGELMKQKLTSDAYLVDDDATVTRWRRGSSYLMYFKMFQPGSGSSILISDNFFTIKNSVRPAEFSVMSQLKI
jgi:hypothetical protein